ncbi:MAG TPA: hypothetical protein DEP35_23930 [Deltaproteobacteria bacterium]|jgi:hypothetical protein|nr:hypothetical protein [Deltaproteobacteria bacterium]
MRDRLHETLSRGTHWAALGLAAMAFACAHPGTEVNPEVLWMSTSGGDEPEFYHATAECLSQSMAAAEVDQDGVFVLCMKRRGWEQQAAVGAPAPTPR